MYLLGNDDDDDDDDDEECNEAARFGPNAAAAVIDHNDKETAVFAFSK